MSNPPDRRPKTPRSPPRSSPTPRGVSKLPSIPPDEVRVADRYAHPRGLIRDVENFPQEGISFKDITPLVTDPRAFHMVIDGFAEYFIAEHIDAIAGVEARGFIFGGALAARLNASFVPLRKPGKLPGEIDRVSYDLEYGSAALEIQSGSIQAGDKVVIIDDVLATGGTALAAAELIKRQGGYLTAFAFVVELRALGGRARLAPSDVVSLIGYD